MKIKPFRILEITWTVTGLICVAAAVRSAMTEGGYRFLIFLLMAAVSFMFAWIRRNQRKKSV